MLKPMTIRRALPGEAADLSELALRSKAHWGYSRVFIESCRSELRVEPHKLESSVYECFVAVEGDTVLGYYAMEPVTDRQNELDALFVDPVFIGRGIGRVLVRHAVERASVVGVETVTIQGDPNASGFYVALGARKVGDRESGSIPGRFLPVFEIDVHQFLDKTDRNCPAKPAE